MDTYKLVTEDSKHEMVRWPEDLIWLPSEGDVLAMLECAGMTSIYLELVKEDGELIYAATGSHDAGGTWQAGGQTRVIALLELLRAVEEA